MAMRRVTASSVVAAPAGDLWRQVGTLRGVNAELWPLLRMTGPPDLSLEDAPLGRRTLRSWLLLGGVLPVDFDDLVLVEMEPGRRFLERSTLGSARRWEHERILEPVPGGRTRLTDRVAFEPRVAALGPLQHALVRGVFAWRHRRLRARAQEAFAK